MSATSGTQIAKPSKEQDFEDNCVVLWKCILKDPNVQKVGRRGQKQKGVDLYGYRDRQRDHLVGLQCKLKTGNQKLTEKEVREEFEKALEFEPVPKEYFILTTADDDQALQALARKLTAEQAKKGLDIVCYVWGWGTLCDEAAKHPDALDAFDPSYGPHGKLVLERQDAHTQAIMDLGLKQDAIHASVETKLTAILSAVSLSQPGGATAGVSDVEAHLDREIDSYRELANDGKAQSALTLFEKLLGKVQDEASGRIVFRIKANIGNCLIKLGKTDEASDKLLEAASHAPEEPKAISNRALGFLLKQDWQAVLDIGRENLASGLADEHLSSHVIQAAKFDTEIDDPLSLIPESHRDTAPVLIAYVDFLRGRQRVPEWWEAAHSALARFPTEQYLRQFASEATLDEATRDPEFLKTGVLKESFRGPVSDAIVVLREIWNKSHSSEGRPDEEAISVLANLLTAMKLHGDLSGAEELVKQGIGSGTTESGFYLKAAIVAMEIGSTDLNVDELLSKVDDIPEKRMLQAQLSVSEGDWKKLATYKEDDIQALPETERLPFGTIVELAKITIGPPDEVDTALRTLVDRTVPSLRSYTIIADFCMMLGREDLADEAYEKARNLIGDDSHYSGRSMLARHAARRERWSDTVDLLINHVNQHVDSDDLRRLTTALANERPIRQRAVKFFKELPAEMRGLPRYQHSEGFLHYYRGELKLAENCLRAAIVGRRADDILLLLSVLGQRGKDFEAEAILNSLSLAEIKGDPDYVMAIVQEALKVGRADDALEFGYQYARQHRNNPQAALKYTGLIFRAFDLDLIPAASVVSTDSSFKLEADDGKSLWLTIDGQEDRISDGVISAGHPFAAKTLGHPVGFSFKLRHGFDKEQEWTVREIKHKYISLFHDVMENFETQFPGVNGISTFRMKEGDIEPVLLEVKKAAENSRQLSELYTDRQIPLAAVAAHLHRDPVSLAGYIKSLGHNVMTCIGQHAERIEALKSIDQHRAAGAVLDTYTAWTVACLDLFGTLTAVFGKLAIPLSVLHDLHHMLGDEEYDERQSFSIQWHDGQYYKHEQTREEFEARRDFVKAKIEAIENNCDVVPVEAPDASIDILTKLVELFGPSPFNAGAVAASGYLLISEDHHYRKWVGQVWPIKGVWLQPVLEYALHQGLIPLEDYAASIGQLGEFRHGFLYLNGPTINAMVGDGQSTDWQRVEAALQFIGTANADLLSHADAVINFVDAATNAKNARGIHFERTLGLLLENLTRGRADIWQNLVWYIYQPMPRRIKGYIIDWVRGHFLNEQLLIALRDDFATETAGVFAAQVIGNMNMGTATAPR